MSHAFWDWSLQAYDNPDVKAASLNLQDAHGLNVNILLWCCWLAIEGRDARPLIDQAVQSVEPWSSDFTRAIRDIRQKSTNEPRAARLYKPLLACELDSERVEQDMLFDLAETAQPVGDEPVALARQALSAYVDRDEAAADLAGFLIAVFPDCKNV